MTPQKLILSVVLSILVLSGCDRGVHPDLVGKAAPDFTVQDEERTVVLRDLQRQGKVVVLNFWASWCEPCVEEMPSLVNLQAKMKDRVTVLAVSTDSDGEAYRTFVRNQGLNFLTVRDSARESSKLYGTIGYPETYIIDVHGIVRRKFVGQVDWSKPEITNYLSSL